MKTNDAREAWLTRLSIGITVVCVVALLRHLAAVAADDYSHHRLRLAIEAFAFGGTVLFLVYGNLLYQWCRLVYYRRRLEHVRTPLRDLEEIHVQGGPTLAILIPSYKEEPQVV